MEMQTQTLYEKLAECWSFKLTWSPMQLGLLVFFTMISLFCSLSTRRNSGPSVAIVLSACYLGINQVCWSAFLVVSGWQGGELVFDFGWHPFIPAFSFYLGILVLAALICTMIHILIQRSDYSFRQLVSILIACVILLPGVAISARTPLALQNLLDSLGPRMDKRREGWSQPPAAQIDPSIMDTIESAWIFLDQQPKLAIWHVDYEGSTETIRYANGYFAEIFGIPVAQILDKKRYQLVNPPDTPDEVIERYKEEDREAIEHGVFLAREAFAPGKDIVVVKLRFGGGMLGLFKIVDSQSGDSEIHLQDLDADFLNVLRQVRPDLLD